MKFCTPLLAVKDLERAKAFYKAVLDQNVMLDLGQNVALEGLALQENFAGLVGVKMDIVEKPNDHELYFEEQDFTGFLARLEKFPEIEYLHRAKEYPWGQRVVRFYDPDGHIIEVGESMESVFKRFRGEGMTVEQVAKRTMHPVEYVRKVIG